MAVEDYRNRGLYTTDSRSAGGLVRYRQIAGGLISLALVLGFFFWGYRIMVRDVSDLPVIKAMEGPARIAPDMPGGELARHMGLSVNSVAAMGEAEEPADTLALAPGAGELGEDARPMAALAPEPPGDMQPEAEAGDAGLAVPEVTGQAFLSETLDPNADAAAAAIALAERIAAGVRPLEPLPGGPAAARPRPRPVRAPGLVQPEAVDAAVAAALAPEPVVREVDPAGLAEGTVLVQIGAYAERVMAEAEWNRAAAQFGEPMQGRGRVIEPVQSGGAVIYRLRADGFADMEAARTFCAALQPDWTTCVATLAP